MSGVTVYGKSSCQDTVRTRDHLRALGVEYEYIDIGSDSAAAELVEKWNGGDRKTPTIVLEGDGRSCEGRSILSVPGNTTLDVELDRQGLLPLTAEGDGSIGM